MAKIRLRLEDMFIFYCFFNMESLGRTNKDDYRIGLQRARFESNQKDNSQSVIGYYNFLEKSDLLPKEQDSTRFSKDQEVYQAQRRNNNLSLNQQQNQAATLQNLQRSEWLSQTQDQSQKIRVLMAECQDIINKHKKVFWILLFFIAGALDFGIDNIPILGTIFSVIGGVYLNYALWRVGKPEVPTDPNQSLGRKAKNKVGKLFEERMIRIIVSIIECIPVIGSLPLKIFLVVGRTWYVSFKASIKAEGVIKDNLKKL